MKHTRSRIEKDIDSSEYLSADETTRIDLGDLFSKQFSNITLLYSSSTGPTELYMATRYGKRFVLKGLKKEFRDDPLHALALAKEFEIGFSLEHANIRRTLGIETVEGIGRMIVMEHVDGSSLATLIQSGHLIRSEARAIVAQIVDALGYMHSKQVYHRDLKPANILVSHNGRIVKLIDFNLSDSEAFVIFKNPAGSKRYMAPELMEPGAAPTAAADIYSLGIVMGELAAHTGDEQLAEAAGRCCVANPKKRPQSVWQIKIPSSQPLLSQTVSSVLASRILTWVLAIICCVISIYIVYKWLIVK